MSRLGQHTISVKKKSHATKSGRLTTQKIGTSSLAGIRSQIAPGSRNSGQALRVLRNGKHREKVAAEAEKSAMMDGTAAHHAADVFFF